MVGREDGIRALQTIEQYGRISHRSEDRQNEESWERFIRSVVLTHGDWSITEHISVSVLFVCDRGVSHEIVRHRIGAYTQESTRFVNYHKANAISCLSPFPKESYAYPAWLLAIQTTADTYEAMVASGVTPERARSVLPTCLATKLVVTYNLRSWRHFFLMRTTKETHPQMRELTIPLLGQFQLTIPLLYDDIEPLARQSDNLCRGR